MADLGVYALPLSVFNKKKPAVLDEVFTRFKLCPMVTSKLEASSQLEIIQLTEDFELAIPVIVGVLDTMW